jgi:hypothetical protein
MVAIIAITIGAALIPSFIVQSNQWAYFAVGCAQFITYVSALADFSWFLYSAMGGLTTSIDTTVSPIIALITILISAPLIIVYITAMVEWSRFNQ